MTHFLSRFRAVLGALAAFFLSTGNIMAAEQSQKTINVGIYAPFTSDSAYIGRNMLGAMEIARSQLKDPEIHYEFYTLDLVSNHANAAPTLQKFIDAHHINILLTERDTSASVVAPLAKKNKLIHFCLGCDGAIADGTHNFQTKSPNHRHGAVLTTAMRSKFVAQFKKEYFSHPVTEAGYAYDIFHVLNNSAVIAMKANTDFSGQAITTHLLALESGKGVLGTFSLNKKGISYKKEVLTA
ncbi:MAG: branched-chain amino acid ABC transporter substrate-binding protein [Legionella sp.]|uniref:branched-chain amino acid ABC transporter substrate-binding protein n=1 Tax=Legionella sp. TaxID=459 RepID=UPI0039E24A0A